MGESIDAQMEVMVYEQAEVIVRAQENIVVAPCICRQERQMVGEGCGKPLETCLSFGTAADFYQ
ncbi:MAG TPA: 4Fe-4S ferredoxin, partial [Anaerolineae bacterium]|nr:4Fe-4S ferredoxin [Anaerolineae bacterium]